MERQQEDHGPGLIFISLFIFLLILIIGTYLTFRPRALEPASQMVIFPHPEDAS